MVAVFSLFVLGFVLLVSKIKVGYYLLGLFLSLEFLFYLWANIGSIWHGYGLFFHLSNPDPVLWTVFAIGYLNFFASGYFLFLLYSHRHQLIGARS